MNGDCALEESRKLREEAATCRELAREIRDAPSIAMFLDRAADLEARARSLEMRCSGIGRVEAGRTPVRPYAELENLRRH